MLSPIKSPGRLATAAAQALLPAASVEIECKKICMLRCLSAVGYSIAMQFLLLTLFLLLVNFSLLHPINWITSTFSLIFSIYTWLCIMPLISLIIIYGIYLGKIHLSERLAPKRRIVIIYKTILPNCLFVMLHVSIGFLTTWFYSRFLSTDMQGLLVNVNECTGNDATAGIDELNADICFNERYFLFTLYGISIAVIYYFKRFPSEATCHFALIHESKYLKIRAHIYSILWSSLILALLPVAASYAAYNFVGRYVVEWLLSTLLNVTISLNNSVHIYDIKLLLHIWILTAHIWSNMNLMSYLFEVFLTDPKQFPIEAQTAIDGSAFAQQQAVRDVTLVEALANTKVPIVRQLAAHDLYTLATSSKARHRRQQVYTLSIPGGHPYNWNALSSQCFSAIDAYNAELKIAIDCVTLGTTKKQPTNNPGLSGYPLTFRRSFMNAVASPGGHSITAAPKSATEMAEKIRQRQYNESAGMRNMMSPTRMPTTNQTTTVDPCARFNECINRIESRLTAFKRAVLQTPGIHYLFAENETARLHSLLSATKTQEIAWIVQGVAAIATHSLAEDHYGVVQIHLPILIQSLLRLKATLDKVPNINGSIMALVDPQQQSGDMQRQQNGAVFIRNAVKRCLYDICITFAEYLPDLVTDEQDWKMIQCFIHFKEA